MHNELFVSSLSLNEIVTFLPPTPVSAIRNAQKSTSRRVELAMRIRWTDTSKLNNVSEICEDVESK